LNEGSDITSEGKVTVRNHEVRFEERDYRGILALMIVAGFIIVLVKGDYQAASLIGPLAGLAVGWYFSSKSERK